MQKIKFFSFLIISVLFINACGSDDDSNNTPTPDPTPTAEEFIENDNDAVVYYPLNGNAENALGNDYNGSVNFPASTSTTDRDGNANSAYIFGPASSGTLSGFSWINFGGVPINGANFTLSFWLKIPDLPIGDDSYRLFSKRSACTVGNFFDIAFSQTTNNGRSLGIELRNTASNSTASTNASDFPIDEWVHVAIIVNSNTQTTSMYWNGELKGENNTWPAEITEFSLEDSANLGISISPCIGIPNVVNFRGSLDDIAIFDRALSTNDIATLGQ